LSKQLNIVLRYSEITLCKFVALAYSVWLAQIVRKVSRHFGAQIDW
jgi:hypothetical protein